MPRTYQQRAPAARADETRQRILDALYRRLEEAPHEPPSIERVAEMAGVARSTVYVVFGSRSGLFEAFADYLHHRAGFELVVAALQAPTAREHLRQGVRAGCETYASVRDVTRAVFSLGSLDPDAFAGALPLMEEDRSRGMRHLARRLAKEGLLRPGLGVDEAADMLWLVTSFDAFDMLFTGRGLPWPAVADRLVAIAEAAVCIPEDPA